MVCDEIVIVVVVVWKILKWLVFEGVDDLFSVLCICIIDVVIWIGELFCDDVDLCDKVDSWMVWVV